MLIELETPRLRLRTWRDSDRSPFAALNQDPHVMEHFPAPIPLLAAKDILTRIGFTGLSIPQRQFSFSPCVEIGWRLAHIHWGQGFATEAACAALAAGFERIGLNEIVSMTALTNLRSQAVMRRIGLADARHTFDHPGVPEGHALRPHCLFRLTAAQWRAQRGTA